MDVLVYLASEPGRVVSKEELLEAVWGGSFVEEGALSQAIHSLRKALGDDARQPRYVQTIPKRGYRLLASVAPEEEAGGRLAVEEAPQAPPEEVQAPTRSQERLGVWSILVLGGLIAVLALWLVWGRLDATRQEQEEPEPKAESGTRIVVLPFENIGKPENAYFADGLTEEITKDLASFPSLQVISRTSALRYAGGGKPLPEIGRELGVQYVLEGTVRWAETPEGRPKVRITPQLIQVEGDAHVWAQSFEREVEDIFEVQAEISRRVINQLGIALTPNEKGPLRPQPTENLEAYRAYLRGLELKNQPYYSEEHLLMAVPMFQRAVDLDPSFALAWAELSQTHSYLVFNADPSLGRVEKARQALDRAIELAPDLPAVRLAQAYFTYRCLEDFESAYEQLTLASSLSPNDAEVLQTLGFVLRRLGRLPEAIEVLKSSFALDPKTVKLVWAIAETYRALRDYEQADRYYAQAISLAPDQPVYWEEKALNRLNWTGKIEEARAILKEAPIRGDFRLVPVEFQLDLFERNYEQALALLSSGQVWELPHPAPSRLVTLVGRHG